MNKTRWALAAILACSLAGASAVSASPTIREDNAFDRLGDWFATFGKEQNEKDAIVTQRKADRIAKRTGDAIEETAQELDAAGGRGAQQVGQAAERAGDDVSNRVRPDEAPVSTTTTVP